MRLEPTAAFVMDLAQGLFLADPLTRRYCAELDLSSGQPLVNDYKKAGIYELAQESMCNRKFAVRHCLFEAIGQSAEPIQIVILAAGKSPLGLEAMVHKKAKVKHLFEVDITSFAEKAKLYSSLAGESNTLVSFLEYDISSDGLIGKMQEKGYDPAQKTVLVIEGITHYLDHDTCRKILQKFVSRDASNILVFEYGQPFEKLEQSRREKAIIAHRVIEQRYHTQGMVKYTPEWLSETLGKLGGKLVKLFPMNEMEKLRTGANAFFKTPDSGWVEVAMGNI